jgi:hypothetical protein
VSGPAAAIIEGMGLIAYLHSHLAGTVVGAACVWISLSLIIRVWLVHGKDPLLKKLAWSLVLCFPFIGWIFSGAFFTPLTENTVKTPVNLDAFNGGH